jgi:Winged helix-turn-helix DNA-binding
MKIDCVVQGYRNRRLILEYLQAKKTWLTAKELSEKFNLTHSSVHVHCRNLIRFGELEELLLPIDCRLGSPPRKVIHYRAVETPLKVATIAKISASSAPRSINSRKRLAR